MIIFGWCRQEQHLSDAFLRTFCYIAPRLLNMLPASLKELDSIAKFKSRLKTFVFVRAFDLSDQIVNESYRL